MIYLHAISQDGPSWQDFVDYNLLWLPPGWAINATNGTAAASRRLAGTAETVRRASEPSSGSLFRSGDASVSSYAARNRFLRQERPARVAAADVRPEARSPPSTVFSVESPRKLGALPDDGPVFFTGTPPTVVTWDDPLTNAAAFGTNAADPSAAAPMVIDASLVVGAIRVRSTSLRVGPCASAVDLRDAPAVCRAPEIYNIDPNYVQVAVTPTDQALEYLTNSDGQVTDLDSADVSQRRDAVDARRAGPGAWVSPGTTSLSIDFTLYNPTLAVFASVRLFTYFPSYGAAAPQVIVRTASLFGTRFQPSVIFEIVVACLAFVQLVQILHASGLRSTWFR